MIVYLRAERRSRGTSRRISSFDFSSFSEAEVRSFPSASSFSAAAVDVGARVSAALAPSFSPAAPFLGPLPNAPCCYVVANSSLTYVDDELKCEDRRIGSLDGQIASFSRFYFSIHERYL